jgi:hypothetical protein
VFVHRLCNFRGALVRGPDSITRNRFDRSTQLQHFPTHAQPQLRTEQHHSTPPQSAPRHRTYWKGRPIVTPSARQPPHRTIDPLSIVSYRTLALHRLEHSCCRYWVYTISVHATLCTSLWHHRPHTTLCTPASDTHLTSPERPSPGAPLRFLRV